jgi:WD40 repeat protein
MKTASVSALAFAFIALSATHAQQPKLRTNLPDNGQVLALAFSPDSRMLATKSFDGTIKLWDVPSGKLRTILQGQTYRLRTDGVVPSPGTFGSVAFTIDGKLLASGSLDNTIKLWDIKTGKVKTTFSGHTEPVASVPAASCVSRISSRPMPCRWCRSSTARSDK